MAVRRARGGQRREHGDPNRPRRRRVCDDEPGRRWIRQAEHRRSRRHHDAAPLRQRIGIGTGGAVLVGDHLYGANSQGLLAIAWETGAIAWQHRSVGAASVAAAEGRLYLRGESGEVALVDASPAGYQERGRFTPVESPDRGKARAWPHPVIADGRLYLRDIGVLWAYDIRAPKP